jgi:outer membrane protein OmpA-like peptidoglycan-associated protein
MKARVRHTVIPAVVVPAVLACAAALLSGSAVHAEDQSEAQILNALKDRGPARGMQKPAAEQGNTDEQRFIEALRRKTARSMTLEDRRRTLEIASEKPSIDLEVTFDYDSDVIGPKAVPTLVRLGHALGSPDLKGAVFLVAGHTDAAGNDGYNQSLSERRAAAVKAFLSAQFNLPSDHLVAMGFGRTQLKNTADPLAPENRRVQIVNIDPEAAVSEK